MTSYCIFLARPISQQTLRLKRFYLGIKLLIATWIFFLFIYDCTGSSVFCAGFFSLQRARATLL